MLSNLVSDFMLVDSREGSGLAHWSVHTAVAFPFPPTDVAEMSIDDGQGTDHLVGLGVGTPGPDRAYDISIRVIERTVSIEHVL